MNYAASGVNIAAADAAKERIKKLAKDTFNDSVLSEIGSFGGFFKPELGGLKSPVLISSADGVGTKLRLAFMCGRHNTVGEDLVNHCVNDILVHGAKPLFFLDYIATGKLDPDVVAEIIEGLARGCRNAGMALLG
ncbi:MAG: AIR synthase related protein, partial [Candidatus Zixiibacteriota bacterium]